MEGLWIVLVLIAISLMLYIGVSIVNRLIIWVSRGNKAVERVLKVIVLLFLLGNFFIAPYPVSKSTSYIDGETKVFDTKDAVTFSKINKWVMIPDFGLIYLKKLDTTNKKGMILYYRKLGISNTSVDLQIKDNDGNLAKRCGATEQGAIILSAGYINFATDELSGEQYILIYKDTEIKLN